MAGEEKQGAQRVAGAVGGAISVGGHVTGSALSSGQNIKATVVFAGPDGAERERVLEALSAIQAELARLTGPKAPAANTLAGAAVDAVKTVEPSKDEIGGFLDSALKTARETAEFASVATKLAPHVGTVANWLGGQWQNLASLLV